MTMSKDAGVLPLRLVVPTRLGEATALRALARAVQETRNALASEAVRMRDAVELARRAEDEPGRARYEGRLLSLDDAVARLDREVCAELDVQDQAAARKPMPTETVVARAAEHGWRLDRPEFPLPETDDARLRTMTAEIRIHRDRFIALAVQFHSGALDLGGTDEARYHVCHGQATAFAMAADHLDELLARGFNAMPAYLGFIETHGSWLERII